MLGRNPLVVHPHRDGLRRLQEAFRTVREFVEVHQCTLSLSEPDMVLYFGNTRARIRVLEKSWRF